MPKSKTTVSADGGKITVHLPFKQFINEHKNLTNILESGVQSAILEEATRQRAELDDIIKQVQAISVKEKVMNMGPQEKSPEPVVEMKAPTLPAGSSMSGKEKALEIIRKIKNNTYNVDELKKIAAKIGVPATVKKGKAPDKAELSEKMLKVLTKLTE